MRICPFIENFHCHAWSGNVNNGENSSFLRIYVTKDNAISEPTWNLDINTVLFILFLKETIEMIILISWISLWQTLLNLCLLLGRRFEMTKKFDLRFCLQGSTKVTIFKTLSALLDITSMSRFETDRIFLKCNFKIWVWLIRRIRRFRRIRRSSNFLFYF